MSQRTKRFSRIESLENRNLLSATTIESEPNDRNSSADFADFSSGQAVLEGISTSDKDKDFFVLTAPSTGSVSVQVSSSNGELPQLEVEDATGQDRFETEPNDGINAGSFAATAGEQLFFRLRAKDDAPAQYSVNVVADNGGGDIGPTSPTNPTTPGNDDGTPDQGSGDAPGTPGADDTVTPGSDDGTPDQGSGDAPGTPGADGTVTPGNDDGTPDQGPGDAPGTPGAGDGVTNPPTSTTSVASETESNDRKSQADPFGLDDDGNATLTGVSESDDDKDFFAFTPAESGVLSVSVESSNGNFAQLEIENAFGVSIFETEPNDGINSGSVNVTGGAVLFVRLRSKTDGPAVYTAQLNMSAGATTLNPGTGTPTTPVPGTLPTGVIAESEVNDRIAQANRFDLDENGNATLQGVSQNDGDKDYFAFTAPALGLLRVNVNSPNGNFAQAQVEDVLGQELFDTDPNDGINNGSLEVSAGQEVFVRMRSKTDGPAEYAVDLVFADGGSRVIGDADGDGSVGFSDFLRLSQFFGRDDCNFSHGDFDGDSSVSFSDFLMLSQNFKA